MENRYEGCERDDGLWFWDLFILDACGHKFMIHTGEQHMHDSFRCIFCLQAMSEMKKRPGDTVNELISAAHYGTIGVRRLHQLLHVDLRAAVPCPIP